MKPTTHYEVRRIIAARPDQIWATLTDAQTLVTGGLGIIRIDGTIAAGAALKVWSEASPTRGFALRVSEFVPHQRMVWEGGMPMGLFKGVREFTLTPAEGTTEFHMTENFSGLLAPLVTRSIPDLTPSFEKFARGLQSLAERKNR